ncbi:Transposase and inactivated derivatives [Olavius algarvensis Delta 1 endosymbiont]|nr:Transposase and inactivated derivatives [Olavius algarvensis Delta 1 endosymbiont]
MGLIAGRTAQQYNQRKKRKGAFWQDRYHATAIETGEHLLRCLVYIDLNMVRAGVVDHPWQRAAAFNPVKVLLNCAKRNSPIMRFLIMKIAI